MDYENTKTENATPEQRNVIYHKGSDILVSASAGSGKTHTMTQRILKLICDDGIEVNRILATTFTEASAMDMRDKIRAEIGKKISQVMDTDKELAIRLSKQLSDFATADISTIHGFCGKLIRTYFFVAGVSPDFRILDQAEADAMRMQAVEKTFAKAYLDGGTFLKVVDRHSSKRSDVSLKELILKIYSYADSEAYPDEFLDKAVDHYSQDGFINSIAEYERSVFARLDDALDSAREGVSISKAINYDKGEQISTYLFNYLGALTKCQNVYQIKNECLDFKIDMRAIGNVKGDKLQVKERIIQGKNLIAEILDKLNGYHADSLEEDLQRLSVCKEHTLELVKLVKDFAKTYAKLKREENVLDFNDLEHFALKILSDEEVATAIQDSYDYIFVDECQDTNDVQDKIISAIEKDNLLMVGDVKQSIYGFRGCRPEFFKKKYDEISSDHGKGQAVRLNANFRSAPAVIDAVNQIFDFCMTNEFYGEDYASQSRLTSGGLYERVPTAKGRFELHQIMVKRSEKEAETPRIYDLVEASKVQRESEDSCTAQLLKKIIEEELTKDYYDIKDKVFKKVDYKDIAVLTRAKGKAGNYVSDIVKDLSAKYNIPVSSVAEENLCDFPEVQMLINALKLVDCFKWDLPLVSTLKSPIGRFTEEELFEISLYYSDNKGNTRDYFYTAYEYYIQTAVTPLAEKLKEFDAYFKSMRFISDFVGAKGTLKRLISDKNLRAYCLAQKNGVEIVNRLDAFMEKAFSGNDSITVKELLNRIDAGGDGFKMTKPSGENAVTVMTIHSSKGLEFPVVIVCGLEKNFNKDDESNEVLFSRNYGLACKYYDDDKRTTQSTFLRRLVLDEISTQTVKEEMRLFYVATTRAKYSLHLVYAGEKDERSDAFDGSSANKYFKLLPKSMQVTPHPVDGNGKIIAESPTKTVLIGDADELMVADMKRKFGFSYSHQADVTLPIKSSVTAINVGETNAERVVLPLFDDEEEKTKTGTALGTNAHKILELYDFNRRDDFNGEIARMLNGGLITKVELDGLDLAKLERAIKGSAFDGVIGKELFREKSFLANVPANLILDTDSSTPVLVQGVIDLLVIDGDTATVIDYKYSALSELKLKDKYKKQLNLYAYAVEKCLGLKVKNKIIVSLLTGRIVEID